MTIAEAIYLLCAATSLLAAGLLLRHYRTRRGPLLFWSSVAFLGLAINNVLVYIDLGLLTGVDLTLPRTIAGALAMLILVYGLVRETGR
jgi:predicted membrane-bound mannosyltransferase